MKKDSAQHLIIQHAKLGARVRLYMASEDGYITDVPTSHTTVAILYACDLAYNEYFVGWEGDKRPRDAVERKSGSRNNNITYMKGDVDKIKWWTVLYSEYRIAGIEGASTPVRETGMDISDWRTWAMAGLQPHECMCRIPRDKCIYHRS